MRRRNFITLLGSTMVMGSQTAHAQQSGGMRRIGVLMSSRHARASSVSRRSEVSVVEVINRVDPASLIWINPRSLAAI
jgi:hypothetical protein